MTVFEAELVDDGAEAFKLGAGEPGLKPGFPAAPGAPAMMLFPVVESTF